ncbi:MAG: efflux RND transporter periplasmic adaptor subunit [Anaerolineaceae bacterium]|nr:efflux RND transporter periplasmic adaptor subunit [Anaerolineaceae bacterium]
MIMEKDVELVENTEFGLVSPTRKIFSRRFINLIIFLLVSLMVLSISSCAEKPAEESSKEDYQTQILERGDLELIVSGTGKLKAKSFDELAWETSGRIGSINVALDQIIEAGTILAELDEGSYSQEIIMAQSELITAESNLENLLDTRVAESEAYAAVLTAQDARDEAVEERGKLNYQQISQSIIDGLKAELQLAENELDNAEQFFSLFEDKSEDDSGRASALMMLSSAIKRRDNALYNLNYALSFPNMDGVAEADAEIMVAEARLEDAEREWIRIKNGPDTDELAAAELRVEAASKSVGRVSLKAPIPGKITQVFQQEGDLVNAGDMAFRIDDCSVFLVETPISEIDISLIEIGQEVEARFDAVEEKSFYGVVVEVSNIGVQSPGSVDFNVIVELDEGIGEIYSGMTAVVEITSDFRKDVIRIPNRGLRKVNGQTIVVVLDQGITHLVEIEIGLSTGSHSELVSGDLKEGDVIVINPPIALLE